MAHRRRKAVALQHGGVLFLPVFSVKNRLLSLTGSRAEQFTVETLNVEVFASALHQHSSIFHGCGAAQVLLAPPSSYGQRELGESCLPPSCRCSPGHRPGQDPRRWNSLWLLQEATGGNGLQRERILHRQEDPVSSKENSGENNALLTVEKSHVWH